MPVPLLPEDPASLVRDAAALEVALAERGQSVATAESLTGGRLGAVLTGVPGASAVYLGGVVAYASAVKRSVLGVTADRVVSARCAEQLACGVRRLLGSDWALSTTGVAGPETQEGQPAGTVYVGLAGPDVSRTQRLRLSGDREAVREQTCAAAIELLSRELG